MTQSVEVVGNTVRANTDEVPPALPGWSIPPLNWSFIGGVGITEEKVDEPEQAVIMFEVVLTEAVWEEPIQLRDVSDNEAKELICNLLTESPDLDELEISDRLAIDFEQVCRLCDSLVEEGRIQRATSSDE